MTHAEIREAILANGWTDKDPGEVAELLNAPQVVFAPTEVGKGTILDVLGLDRANPVLDEIENNARFRHVRELLVGGKLRLDWESVRNELAGLVAAGLVTGTEMDALLDRARQTVTAGVTWQQVRDALEGI